MKNVVAFDLSPAKAKEQIAEIAKNSGRVFFTDHAEERMIKRKITRKQVHCCLKHGVVIENPVRDLYGDWKVTLETLSAGDPITVVAVLRKDKKGELILVITSYK